MTDSPEHEAGAALPPHMAPKPAAAWLATQTPKRTELQWSVWLQNNRQKDKLVNWRLPFIKLGRNVFYKTADLQMLARISNISVGLAEITKQDQEWIEHVRSLTKNPPSE